MIGTGLSGQPTPGNGLTECTVLIKPVIHARALGAKASALRHPNL